MPTSPGSTGYQPRTTPAERRAFFDLQRQIKEIEDAGGVPGPPGPAGPAGPPGPGGEGTDEVWVNTSAPTDAAIELWYDPDAPSAPVDGMVAYEFVQGVASAVWTITHPLSFIPNVLVVDSTGSQVEGDVVYTSDDTITLTFSGAFSGKAYLS